MDIVRAAPLPATPIPGITHSTVAGSGDGFSLSVWEQDIAPGHGTPPHRHDCDEIVRVVHGRGTLFTEGVAHPFAAGDTLVLRSHCDHQIVNDGDVPLRLFAAFATSPVVTRSPEGEVLPLPWAS